jgi:hypothetical protein
VAFSSSILTAELLNPRWTSCPSFDSISSS